MFLRALVTLFVVCSLDTISGFAISPESVALQTAALGSKLSDIRDAAAEATHHVGESFQGGVNAAVDSVNQASASATASFNHALATGQNAVNGAVHSTQNAFNSAVQATQQFVEPAVETASNAFQKASDVALTPFRLVGKHVSDKFVLISNKLYKIVHPNLSQEVVYVPVDPEVYSHPAVVANHKLTYTEVPSYVYQSGGVEEFLASGSEDVEAIVVPEAPKTEEKEGKSLETVEFPEVRLPEEPIYEIDPNTKLNQFNQLARSKKSESSILPYDERELMVKNVVRTKRVVAEIQKQFFR